MSVQQFCLRWNNHQPNFISVFSTLLHNESLVDVTLAAEGRHLQAHKVVLSACSSYFQSLFTVNPCQHPIVILKDVKYNDLKTMVDFMYYGEVNVSQEQLPHILKTAEMLKIKGLAEMPDSTSLTKSQSTSLDRAEITPGDSNWGSETHRHSSSPAPMSPASRRKRLRKSSTGSGSLSTERNSEDHPTDLISPTLIKPEPIPFIQSTALGNLRGSKQDTSTESEAPLESSQESLDEESSNNNPHMVHQKSTDSESNISVVQSLGGPSVVEHAGPSVSAGCSQTPTHHPGLQWTLVEHGYPRFALPSCQTQMDGNEVSPSNLAAPSNVPMQYTTGSYPTSQVISVNSCGVIENSYQSNVSTPTSPQDSQSPHNAEYPAACQTPVQHQNTPAINPVKRKRSQNPQADENFVRALDAVRFGGIGFCKAARMYGVNNRTLWLEYKKRGYPISRPSIKNRVKVEHLSPPPPQPPTENQPEEFQPSMSPSPSLSIPQSEPGPVMCPPHPMGIMSYLDTRHVEFSPGIHMSRQRFPEGPVNMNPSAINLHGVNYNTM